MKITLILFLGLAGCAKDSSTGNSPQSTTTTQEVQYELPNAFKGSLDFKELGIGVLNQWGSCLPIGCTLGGTGKDTRIFYNSKTCYLDTALVKNYRTNYYHLTITQRVEDIPNFGYLPNPTECNELIGQYWVHHNGLDNENLFHSNFHNYSELPFNATIEQIE